MGAGNMDGPAGRDMMNRMREEQTRRTDPSASMGPGRDLSRPEGDMAPFEEVLGKARENKANQTARSDSRQEKFLSSFKGRASGSETETRDGVETMRRDFDRSFSNPEEMRNYVGSNMQPQEPSPGSMSFDDYRAMMGGPQQQGEFESQQRQPVEGQALQAGTTIDQELARLTKRGRQLPTEYGGTGLPENYMSM